MKTYLNKLGGWAPLTLGVGLLGTAVTLGATLGVATIAATSLTSPAVGDSTIGSLPSADEGDGSQNFYLAGPRELVADTIVDTYGDGFYVLIALPDDQVWIEFYGDVTVHFDQGLLEQHPELQLGLSAGFNGGGMVLVPEIDGEFSSREFSVEAGHSFQTPYARFAGLLDAPLSFHSTQVLTGLRGETSFLALNSRVIIQQDLK
ncbi:MAG: hypothetical protein O2816_12910 [Planctomycetota bacterium]|nr:hypothetical protein [Planctomycetota bacterium]